MIRMPASVKIASTAAVNLLSRSRIRKRNRSARSPSSLRRLRACWVTQAPGWVGGDPGQVHAATVVLDDEEDVEAAQEHGVDVGEVDCEDRVGLRRQELPPGRTGPPRGGSNPAVLRMFQTVEAATVWPRPISSPWILR